MKRTAILAVMTLTLLWGCTTNVPSPQGTVVHRICVEQAEAQVSCTDPHTMRQILNALRWPGQLIIAKEDPQTLPLPQTHLTLFLTDGTSRRYTIKGHRYLKKDDGPWMESTSDHLTGLLTLLGSLAPPQHTDAPTHHGPAEQPHASPPGDGRGKTRYAHSSPSP